MIRIDPPTTPGQGARRFFMGLIVVVPTSLAGGLVFDVIGWSPRLGSVIGLGVGMSFLPWVGR
jgi:hypothetical protein